MSDSSPEEADSPSRRGLSRRTVVQSGAALLAAVAITAASPQRASAALSQLVGSPSPSDLALYRPTSASTTDYAPTPANFAVDGFVETGVRGSGWRAATGSGEGQWIAVDLQGVCSIERVRLTFEAALTDPAFNGNYGETYGNEVLSSAATAFSLQVSSDGHSWQDAYATTTGPGGVVDVRLPKTVKARWIRMVETARSNTNPVGLNGFEVYGVPQGHRPAATGWTDWSDERLPAPALAVASDGTVPIDTGWELTADSYVGTSDGKVVSTPGSLQHIQWLPAVVPGTVHGALVAEGKLPDPVGGFANLHAPEALSRHDWWYRRDFTIPRGLNTGPRRHVWLELDGITQTADVFVNGQSVGSVANPFVRGHFDIAPFLSSGTGHGHQPGAQTLAVRTRPMAHPGVPGDKSSNGNTFLQGGHLFLDSPTYLASSGWDWMPAVRDRGTGIWNHVRLRSTGHAVIGDAHVVTKLPNLPALDVAELTITVPVRNAGKTSISTRVSISFDSVNASQTITVPANTELDVVFSPTNTPALRLRRPRLWWPNGYGDPTLHALTITTAIGGATSDKRTTQFGIRQFDYASNQPIVVPQATTPTFIVAQGSDQPGQVVTFPRQTARYVRLKLDTRATQYGFSIWRFAVLDSKNSAGSDLAQGHAASASSTGESWGTADKAVDGDASTRWASEYADDQWLEVDLGSNVSFDTVQVAWENAYAARYEVQTSDDGKTWDTAQAVDNTGAYGDSFVQTETFASQTARFVRIQGGKRVSSYGISMWRLSVYNEDDPTDLALSASATSSSDDGNPASNAVDGNPRTRWSSGYQDNQWIQVDLGAPRQFSSIAIDWELAYARDYTIQVSDDGTTWRTALSVDNRITQLTLSVNGVRVFCRGGNWGYDELLRRVDAGVSNGRLENTVRMHRDMNFTMIRNWLGSSDRDELYALCDQYGLLMWNDFWEAGQFPDDIPGYVDTVVETIRRYRIHPSIVVWCGANEEEPPGHIDAGMAKAVADHEPDTIYIPNSAGGIASGHGPYRWVEPSNYYDKTTYDTGTFGFHTEIGMPVLPVTETMRNLVGDERGWPIGEVWNYHDWSETANQQTAGYKAAIEDRLGTAESLDQLATRAQFVNYENHRAMFEAWNANLWNDATALLLWMSHPAWYSTVWQTYDYDLDVNGAYYGARAGCEPLHVQASPTDWQIVAVNHTTTARKGVTVRADVYDLNGRRLGERREVHIDMGASSTTRAFVVEVPAHAPALHLVRLTMSDHTGTLSTNTYWRYQQPNDMRLLTTGPKTRLGLTGHSIRPEGGRRSTSVTVSNRGGTVAAMTRLSVRTRRGERVLPATYSDNYFWLLPGESREVAVQYPAASGNVSFRAEAYNAPAVTA
ncbi:discoidin domain-containing protein [Curtobacterium sp. PhB136]|uniref:discoidin domain-containing protein n=1 Tax=Curtobacterium sp. PhB136 TaxID=2485181 RepID=UPI00104D0166|nr:discoidin domain-containing protein [Curtobacterium sp. PhB136]TCK65805.1 glycosyl hydrolase family 2 [Curtobacterium sp. PhB136]